MLGGNYYLSNPSARVERAADRIGRRARKRRRALDTSDAGRFPRLVRRRRSRACTASSAWIIWLCIAVAAAMLLSLAF